MESLEGLNLLLNEDIYNAIANYLVDNKVSICSKQGFNGKPNNFMREILGKWLESDQELNIDELSRIRRSKNTRKVRLYIKPSCMYQLNSMYVKKYINIFSTRNRFGEAIIKQWVIDNLNSELENTLSNGVHE